MYGTQISTPTPVESNGKGFGTVPGHVRKIACQGQDLGCG